MRKPKYKLVVNLVEEENVKHFSHIVAPVEEESEEVLLYYLLYYQHLVFKW